MGKLLDKLRRVQAGGRPFCTMIVPAAGSSARMGGGDKLMMELEGVPVLVRTLRALDAALVFYESPNRLAAALGALATALPQREVAVCRELTKLHEEVVRGPLPQVRDEFAERTGAGGRGVKGEIVIVVDGPNAAESAAAAEGAQQAAAVRAAELKAAGARNKDIARSLADEFGIARNAAYDLALKA